MYVISWQIRIPLRKERPTSFVAIVNFCFDKVQNILEHDNDWQGWGKLCGSFLTVFPTTSLSKAQQWRNGIQSVILLRVF